MDNVNVSVLFPCVALDGEEYVFIPTDDWRIIKKDIGSVFSGAKHIILMKRKKDYNVFMDTSGI